MGLFEWGFAFGRAVLGGFGEFWGVWGCCVFFFFFGGGGLALCIFIHFVFVLFVFSFFWGGGGGGGRGCLGFRMTVVQDLVAPW